jgi:hypothetical protein
VTRAATGAANRRAAYDRRVAAAPTSRRKVHALVWWWMAEWKRLPVDRRQVVFGELEAATAALNEGGVSDDVQ